MTRAIALLTLAGALHGCASAGKSAVESMPPPSSPREARQQMDQLEQMIRDNRVALGLPAQEEVTIATGRATGGAEPAAPRAPGPPPAMAPPEPASADAAEEAPLARESRAPSSGWRATRRHCAPGCRYTKAICQAAGRICGLARYLGDEDASRRCQRAERDCRDARRATASRDCDDCD